MEPEAFHLMAAQEDRHWWFVGRRAVVGALLDRIELPPEARVLEAGCGTGGNLYMLAERGHVSAFEPSNEARDLATSKDIEVDLAEGALPSRVPFEPASFDLVVGLDVLEHIEEDASALRALMAMVRPEGRVLITVPAVQALWGSHDRRLHHVRRYDLGRMRRICVEAGAVIEYETYFNTLLAPIAVAYRLMEKIPGIELGNQERMPPRFVNRVFARLFSVERFIVAHGRLPVGLSIGVILRRP
jgi:SAM-dependent methyltransferase